MARVVRLPKPTIELSLEAGGSLQPNTTYYFSGYYNGFDEPYYSIISSPAADQVSITTTTTDLSIRIIYKWYDVDHWDYGLPPDCPAVDTRWDLVTQLDGNGDFYPWLVDGGYGDATYGSRRWTHSSAVTAPVNYLWTVEYYTNIQTSRYRCHPELAWYDPYCVFPKWADRKAGAMGLYLEAGDDRESVLVELANQTDVALVDHSGTSSGAYAGNMASMIGSVRFTTEDIFIDRINLSLIGGMILGYYSGDGSGFNNSTIYQYQFGCWNNFYGTYFNTHFFFRGRGTVSLNANPAVLELNECQLDKGLPLGMYSPPGAYRTGDFTFVNSALQYSYPYDYNVYGCYNENIKIIGAYFYTVTANSTVQVPSTKHTRWYNCILDNRYNTPSYDLSSYSYKPETAQEIRWINFTLKTIRADEQINSKWRYYVADNRPKLYRSQVSYSCWHSFWYQFSFKITDSSGINIETAIITITNTVTLEEIIIQTDINGEVVSEQRTRYATAVLTTNGYDWDWFDFEDFTINIFKAGYTPVSITKNSVREKLDIAVTLSIPTATTIHNATIHNATIH